MLRRAGGAVAQREAAVNLLSLLGHSHGHIGGHASTCPACSGRRMATVGEVKGDYAFEIAGSSVRFGSGASREVGMDAKNLGMTNVVLFTDPAIAKTSGFNLVREALASSGVKYTVYDRVRAEPTEVSFREAIEFSKQGGFDGFIALGGGSVMDTAKAANLYTTHSEADFLDFVNAPIGKGKPVTKRLFPLIALPTTAGTGSETTGTAIFDYKAMGAKTGITYRAIRPTLGIVDTANLASANKHIRTAAGLDVLCHAIESYTAIPYSSRLPIPSNPIERPTYQGSNPISDIWSLTALKMTVDALPRTVRDPDDAQALADMSLAATYAGIGFGNAGVHLCHGLSYPISGLNKSYKHPGYEHLDHPLVPHGVSVAITAPAVFEFTGATNPQRHLEVAKMFGADVSNARDEDAGRILGDALRKFLNGLDVPNGLSALGFASNDIPKLVEGAIPQQRVLKLSPREPTRDALAGILENAMRMY